MWKQSNVYYYEYDLTFSYQLIDIDHVTSFAQKARFSFDLSLPSKQMFKQDSKWFDPTWIIRFYTNVWSLCDRNYTMWPILCGYMTITAICEPSPNWDISTHWSRMHLYDVASGFPSYWKWDALAKKLCKIWTQGVCLEPWTQLHQSL